MLRILRPLTLTLALLLLATPGREVLAMPINNEIEPVTLNAETIETFVDNFVDSNMEPMTVPGTAIVVVQDDEVIFANGYGLADIEANRPVDVAQTVFRVGSVSKLFTATAVMQLVESGKLELAADVNRYLTHVQIPSNGGPPVTVADLLLHTTGFDDVFLGMHGRSEADFLPLDDFLQVHLPPRYEPAGAVISYNDHGYTLAGLLVEELSGLSFEQYVAENILQPLQMDRSSFAQPYGAVTPTDIAVGYWHDGQTYQPYVHDIVNVGPAAALTGPAQEMSHFMLAHLNDGEYAGRQILQPETVAMMQATQVRNHPELRGRGYGFAEWQENGYRAIFHDGGNPGFLNRLYMIPEAKVGFFITFNGDQYGEATRFHREFTTQFMATFFPARDQLELPVASQMTRSADEFSGYYREMTGYSHDTLQKIATLPNQFAVTGNRVGLQFFGREYVPVSPLLFKSSDAVSTVAFAENGQGQIEHLFVGTGAYKKVSWYESQPVQLALAVGFVLVFLSAIIAAFSWRTAPLLLRGSLAFIGLMNLFFLLGMAYVLLQMDPWQFAYGLPTNVAMLLTVPLLTTVVAVILLGLIGQGWLQGEWSWLARANSLVMTLSVVGFPLFLNFWNLFGYRV